jgi:hypothetical protein
MMQMAQPELRPMPVLLSQEVRDDLRRQVQRLEEVVDDLERLITVDDTHRDQHDDGEGQ